MKCTLNKRDFGEFIAESINPVSEKMGSMPSFDMVNSYLRESNGYSQFAFCVVWSKAEEIWTLGGRPKSPVVQEGLKYLKELWGLTKLSEGRRDFTGGFDDGNDATVSPMGENDQKIITGLAEFMCRIGLSKLGENYKTTVQHYFPERDLNKTARLTSWISFAYTEKTGVYLRTMKKIPSRGSSTPLWISLRVWSIVKLWMANKPRRKDISKIPNQPRSHISTMASLLLLSGVPFQQLVIRSSVTLFSLVKEAVGCTEGKEV
ncbi:Aromatic prenyltransferase DMATS type [Penicillium hetheringtonii]|uniref:Aromatic prenyltransferase DMATS type n=1 Tax=Penicillium hetheringtonii TaxID=911720 RepID=A0AAD6DW56_9EURO|nr:Aromatic prenyltransferase DMATS type [Penicillium hetheringtonii]